MARKNSIRQRRKKASNMGPWDTDENGEFARGKPVVDPIFIIGLFPILGTLYALVMIFSGHAIDGRKTGVSQQAIRSGHVGLVAQVFWVVVLLIGMVI